MDTLLDTLNHNLKTKHRRFVRQQHPKFAVLACSDSRVDVEDIFRDTYNKVFVIENAGNTANNNWGTIWYALEHLQVEHFLVIGHSSCGACKYSFDTRMTSEEKILDKEFKEIKEVAEDANNLREVEIHNVENQVQMIQEKFPECKDKILGMYYDMEQHKLIKII
jgi:carbonic anhydrase